jgi:NAD(P)-dependent dehydrogenase (short-subunit alcohol dehydrogenase family)
MSDTVSLVTGGNKGIGLEICRQLARKGHTVLLGSRDLKRGEEAAAKLRGDKLDVTAVKLDMQDAATFDAARDIIAAKYGRLDVLVNNAAIGEDWQTNAATVAVDTVRKTFEVNVFALIDLTQRLLPLLRKSQGGRVVNQSSQLGSLTLLQTPDSGVYEVQALAYDASKTAVNAFTVHLAALLKGTPIKVNSAHPGSVETTMNPSGKLTPAEGAETAVTLATLPADGPTGGFFHRGQTLPW